MLFNFKKEKNYHIIYKNKNFKSEWDDEFFQRLYRLRDITRTYDTADFVSNDLINALCREIFKLFKEYNMSQDEDEERYKNRFSINLALILLDDLEV